MCGIAGILSLQADRAGLEKIHPMADSLAKRGPDDEGFAFFRPSPGLEPFPFGGRDTPQPVYLAGHRYSPREPFAGSVPPGSILALGHRRLSIIDLSPAGHQPMATEDGRHWIVFNGEIYNYRQLRQELARAGERFSSDSDTEVILKAYRSWGPGCVDRFVGMWAFAIWDQREQRLFCCRDPIGIKPFYYVASRDFFLFASDIKALIASTLYSPTVDWQGVYHAMSFGCAPRPTTCFQDVFALEPGSWMVVDSRGKMDQERYWSLPTGRAERQRPDSFWVEALEEALKRSIRHQLVADVPVGTFMSGGIDSTTVSALAALEKPGITAFTLAFDPGGSDESPQARATARMYPMQHVIQRVDPEELLDKVDIMVRCYEEPFPSLSPNYFISRLVARSGMKVVLSGLGPDEMLCGYGRTSRLPLWRLARLLRFPFPSLLRAWPRAERFQALASAKTISDYYVYVFSTFKEPEKKKLFKIPAAREWSSPARFASLYRLDSIPFSDEVEALCYLDMINYIGNHHLYRLDQFTMHFSIEGRFPFLDRELMELCFRMPSRMKLRGKTGKYALREVAKKYIDPSCLAMEKKGFSLPMESWIRSELQDIVHQSLGKLKQRDDVFSAGAIDDVQKRCTAGREGHAKLWFLVSLQLWLDSFSLR